MQSIFLYLTIIILVLSPAKSDDTDLILSVAKDELNRYMKGLEKEENPPYFISYHITDSKETHLSASFGKIKSDINNVKRLLDIDLRVGSYKFDNTHIIRGESFSFSSGAGSQLLPLDNNEKALRSQIWFATDISYKNAIERYEKALTNQKVKIQEDDTSSDLSQERIQKYKGKKTSFKLDMDYWKNLIRKVSTIFNEYDWIYQGDVVFIAEELSKYLVNSEGSELSWDESYSRMYVLIKTKAEDGMSLPLFQSYFSYDPLNLPKYEKIESDVRIMIEKLEKLRVAPLATTFQGPAILSGSASGVFFHEIFGHRVEGHREKDPNSSQTFKQSIDKEILPEFISVIFDPTMKTRDGYEISGYYEFDDEGVKSQRVVTVQNGKFKNFLMSRSPIENFSHSNGHGRKQAGYSVVSRQSNLIVESNKQVSMTELKEMLREECRKQDKEYGLYFEDVQGGFTFTSRTIPNAFNVNPLIVYKIYADGRPDEMVRGVDLIGTPLTTFSNIIASGDDMEVFNGICGAESGGVPVSASSPSMLVSKIEVQKKKKSQAKLPILSKPEQKHSN